MNVDLLTARDIPNGYTWTLSSRLGDMLYYSEKMFGERDKSFTILGIEFMETGPRIWYPKNNKSIVVQLTPEALNSEAIALYQLAHESVHLLSPSGSANANVLEEGIAVWFSWWYLKHTLGIDGEQFTGNVWNYFAAGTIVKKFMQTHPDFFKTLRQRKLKIWETTPEELMDIVPEMTPSEAKFLTIPFNQLERGDLCFGETEEKVPTSLTAEGWAASGSAHLS